MLLELAMSLGNVDVDSDSVRSVVDSKALVEVVVRVASGGQGRNLVVLEIVGRVVRIDVNDDEPSELDELSVDIIDEVCETSVENSTPVDAVDDNCVDDSRSLVAVAGSVVLLKSRTSSVEEKEPSIDVVGTDCVIVDVYTEGKSVGN